MLLWRSVATGKTKAVLKTVQKCPSVLRAADGSTAVLVWAVIQKRLSNGCLPVDCSFSGTCVSTSGAGFGFGTGKKANNNNAPESIC